MAVEQQARGTCHEVPVDDTTSICKLCFQPATPPSGVKLGPLYEYVVDPLTEVYCAHYFCLLFSSALDQNGEEEEGIKGFLPQDILKEWRRGQRLKCVHCPKKYATVGCVAKGCRKTFHLPCAVLSGGLLQFCGDFPIYCADHRPVQVVHCGVKTSELRNADCCGICLDDLEEIASPDVLWTPCCGGWFHRPCVENLAETSGYFFKCPLCNNKDDFEMEMKKFGVFVPEQDAAWETQPNAFEELLERPGTCDTEECICPDGRAKDEACTEWEVVLCRCCGAHGIHVRCGGFNPDDPIIKWKCSFCKEVLEKLPPKPIPKFRKVDRRRRVKQQGIAFDLMEKVDFKVTLELKVKSTLEGSITAANICPRYAVPGAVKVKKSKTKVPKMSQTGETGDTVGGNEIRGQACVEAIKETRTEGENSVRRQPKVPEEAIQDAQKKVTGTVQVESSDDEISFNTSRVSVGDKFEDIDMSTPTKVVKHLQKEIAQNDNIGTGEKVQSSDEEISFTPRIDEKLVNMDVATVVRNITKPVQDENTSVIPMETASTEGGKLDEEPLINHVDHDKGLKKERRQSAQDCVMSDFIASIQEEITDERNERRIENKARKTLTKLLNGMVAHPRSNCFLEENSGKNTTNIQVKVTYVKPSPPRSVLAIEEEHQVKSSSNVKATRKRKRSKCETPQNSEKKRQCVRNSPESVVNTKEPSSKMKVRGTKSVEIMEKKCSDGETPKSKDTKKKSKRKNLLDPKQQSILNFFVGKHDQKARQPLSNVINS